MHMYSKGMEGDTGKTSQSILKNIANKQLAYFNEKITFIEVVINK